MKIPTFILMLNKIVMHSAVISVLFCSALTLAKAKNTQSARADRTEKMERLVDEQNQIIVHLRQEISRLKNASVSERVSPHPKMAEPQAVVQKLLPDDEGDLLEKEDIDKILGTDEESVADSSHEMMHYYYEGQKYLAAGNYDEALKNLKKFIDENPSHVYVDRAQFLVFDTYFKGKEYGLAILAANTLETRHPYSFKLQEALYKKGLALEAMNQKESARITFESLIKRFPNHAFAETAGKELVAMTKKELKTKGRNQAAVPPPLLDDAQ